MKTSEAQGLGLASARGDLLQFGRALGAAI